MKLRNSPIGTYFIHWLEQPEMRLLAFALPLEMLWEIAQLPLYTVWREHTWGYILYSVAHCTIGDLIILLACFSLLALLNRDRRWLCTRVWFNTFLFTFAGAAYTIYSEITNTGLAGSWNYTELMPIVPMIDIGAAPLLQWLVIPPVLLWLMAKTMDKTTT